MWLPYNGKSNKIRVNREKHHNYIVIELEGENEPDAYSSNIVGNYLVESFLGNFNANTSPLQENLVISKVENYSQIDSSKCINFVDKPVVNPLFWKLFFDGSKFIDGVGASQILVSAKGEKLYQRAYMNLNAQITLLNMKRQCKACIKPLSLISNIFKYLEIQKL